MIREWRLLASGLTWPDTHMQMRYKSKNKIKLEANSKCVKRIRKHIILYLLSLPAHPKQKEKLCSSQESKKQKQTKSVRFAPVPRLQSHEIAHVAGLLIWVEKDLPMEKCQAPGEECITRSLTIEIDIKSLKGLNPSCCNAGRWIYPSLGHESVAHTIEMLRSLIKPMKWSNCTTRYHSTSSETGKTRDRPHPRVKCIKMRKLREGTLSQCHLPKAMRFLHALDPEKFS